MYAACLLLPTVAHVTAGGGVPVHLGFLFAAGLLSIACVALADRRRNPAEIAAVLLASQPALHVLLGMAGHGHGAAPPNGMSMVVAHVIAAGVLTVLLAGAESVVWAMSALSTTVLLRRVRRLLAGARTVQTSVWTPKSAPETGRVSQAERVGGVAPRRGPPALLLG
jgi:hypothetical protein